MPALSVSSLHMPGVWLAAGHTQIDWCNQLVRRLSAALLEVHAQQQWRLQHPGPDSPHEQQAQQQGAAGPHRSLLLRLMQRQQASAGLEGSVEQSQQLRLQQQKQKQQLLPHSTSLCGLCNASCNTAQQSAQLQLGRWWQPAVHRQHHSHLLQSAAVRLLRHRRALREQQPHNAGSSGLGMIRAKQPKRHQQWQLLDSPMQAEGGLAGGQLQHQQQGSVDMGVLLQPSAPAPAAAAAVGALQSDTVMEAFRIESQQPTVAAVSEGCSHRRRLANVNEQISVAGAAGSGAAGPLLHASGPAASTQWLLQHYLVSHTATAFSKDAAPALQASSGRRIPPANHLPELLLPTHAPTDVLLAHRASCSGPQPQPQWFIHSQHAIAAHVPPSHAPLTARPTAAEPGGAVYFWDVPGVSSGSGDASGLGPADFVVVVSGAKPCSSFRVWLQQQHQQQQHWQDVTGSVAPLPVLRDELVSSVRHFK